MLGTFPLNFISMLLGFVECDCVTSTVSKMALAFLFLVLDATGMLMLILLIRDAKGMDANTSNKECAPPPLSYFHLCDLCFIFSEMKVNKNQNMKI